MTDNLPSNTVYVLGNDLPHRPRPRRSLRHSCLPLQRTHNQIPHRSMGPPKVRYCCSPDINHQLTPRSRMIITGLAGVIIIEIYAAVMQREFQNTNNRIGKGFAILGIYLFVVIYYGLLNSTTWLYGAEVLPLALRSKVMGLAAASHFIVNVASTSFNPFSTLDLTC